MKLHEIKEGSKIYAECSDGSTFLIFHHIDGMYSYCTTAKGSAIHLSAVTPLIEVGGTGGEYKIDIEKQKR